MTESFRLVRPERWRAFTCPEKDELEQRVLNEIGKIVWDANYTPRIFDFSATCPIPWYITFRVTVDWGWLDLSSSKHTSVELVAKFEFNRFVKLEATRRHVYSPELLAISDAIMAFVEDFGSTLSAEPSEPDPTTPEAPAPPPVPPAPPSHREDLASALKSLGFNKSEAALRIEQAYAKALPGASLQDLIALSLKKENAPCR